VQAVDCGRRASRRSSRRAIRLSAPAHHRRGMPFGTCSFSGSCRMMLRAAKPYEKCTGQREPCASSGQRPSTSLEHHEQVIRRWRWFSGRVPQSAFENSQPSSNRGVEDEIPRVAISVAPSPRKRTGQPREHDATRRTAALRCVQVARFPNQMMGETSPGQQFHPQRSSEYLPRRPARQPAEPFRSSAAIRGAGDRFTGLRAQPKKKTFARCTQPGFRARCSAYRRPSLAPVLTFNMNVVDPGGQNRAGKACVV